MKIYNKRIVYLSGLGMHSSKVQIDASIECMKKLKTLGCIVYNPILYTEKKTEADYRLINASILLCGILIRSHGVTGFDRNRITHIIEINKSADSDMERAIANAAGIPYSTAMNIEFDESEFSHITSDGSEFGIGLNDPEASEPAAPSAN